MRTDSGNAKREREVNPVGNDPGGGCSRLRYLIVYFVYAVVVLIVGIKLGVLSAPQSPPIIISPGSQHGTPERLNPLGAGILAFDAEYKKATVHGNDAQAHFVFSLTNTSKHVVVVNQVNTSCGCTLAQLPQMPWRLKPQASGQITVTMTVSGHTGVSQRTVTILTTRGFKVLSMEAETVPLIDKQSDSSASAGFTVTR